MSKHTPGPWLYQEQSDAYTHIVRADGRRFICQLAQDTSGVAEADARLIAAAPELFSVLVHLKETIFEDTDYECDYRNLEDFCCDQCAENGCMKMKIDAVDAAIAKATGVSP